MANENTLNECLARLTVIVERHDAEIIDHEERLRELEHKPNKIISTIITAIVSGVVAFVIGYILK